MKRQVAPPTVVLLVSILGACGLDPPGPVEVEQRPIVGGQTASACQWPTTVLLNGCTGTLVHPLIVTTAAHCGTNHKTAIFGETSGGAARRIPIEYCKVFQTNGSDATDFAFCKLRTAVTDVPIIPPLMGCEVDVLKAGQKVVVAGFGDNNDKNGGFGTKRWVETTVNRPDTGRGAQIGGMGKAPCYGDSGGPAFVQLADGSWRAFGIDSSGLADSCNAGDIMAMIYKAVPWIEQQSGVDISPCHDADGKWNPGPDCHGFSTDPLATGRSWANGCAEATPSPPSTTCGMPGVPGDGGAPLPDASAGKEAGVADARLVPDLAADVAPVPPDAAAAPVPPDARPQPGPSAEPEPEADAAVTSGHAAAAGCHCGLARAGGVPGGPAIVLALLGVRRARRRLSRHAPAAAAVTKP